MQAGSIIFRRPLFSTTDALKTGILDSNLILFLWAVANHSPTVASILDFVSMWATTSAWSIEVTSQSTNSKSAYSDENLNRRFAIQLEGKLELIIQHILIFGWVVIKYTIKENVPREDVTGNDMIVNVMHPFEYEIRFKVTKRGNKKWLAYPRMTTITETKKPIPFSRVFMFKEPEPLVGRPTSALMKAMRSVFDYDELFALDRIIRHKRAFPIYMYKSDVEKLLFPTTDPTVQLQGKSKTRSVPEYSGMGHPPATTPEGVADIGLAEVDAQFLREMNAKQAMFKMAKSVHEQAARADDMSLQMGKLSANNKDYTEDFVKTAVENPHLPTKFLNPGIELEDHVPEPKTTDYFQEVELTLKTQIATLLGVPLEFIFPIGSKKFATDALLSRKIMETRTTRLHRWLSGVLSEIWLDIHFADAHSAFASFSHGIAMRNVKSLEGGLDKETMMRAQIMLKEKYKSMIEKDILVSTHFAETTSATEESLLNALQTGVIDMEKYQSLVLSSLGIPQSAVANLTEKEKKEIVERIRNSVGQTDQQIEHEQKTAMAAKKNALAAGKTKNPAKKQKTSKTSDSAKKKAK